MKKSTGGRITKFSEDYDKTLIISRVFWLLTILFAGLFLLEAILLWRGVETQAHYLTPSMFHTIITFVCGWIGNIISNMFVDKMAQKAIQHEERMKNGEVEEEEGDAEQTSAPAQASTNEESKSGQLSDLLKSLNRKE